VARILVVYHSESGNTAQMAEHVAEGVREAGAEVVLKEVAGISVDELTEYDGIVAGSPTYYGTMSGVLKQFFDESVKHHGSLTGKVGGAFTSSGAIAGGNETTILSILMAMLIHGMIVQGTSAGDHYGAAAIGAPDDRAVKAARAVGRRVAELANKLA
jgi:NAD(P)H dehydrogenase (quinone)